MPDEIQLTLEPIVKKNKYPRICLTVNDKSDAMYLKETMVFNIILDRPRLNVVSLDFLNKVPEDTVVFRKSITSSSPTVATPSAALMGVTQNGGHAREVFENSGSIRWVGSWFRWIVTVCPFTGKLVSVMSAVIFTL